MKKWEQNIVEEISYTGVIRDHSIYNGISGYALLYLELGQLLNNQDYIEQAFFLAEKCTFHLREKHLTFLTGDTGPLSIISVCAHLLKQHEKEQHYIHRYFLFFFAVLKDSLLFYFFGLWCSKYNDTNEMQ